MSLTAAALSLPAAAAETSPIQLHVELEVDAAKEKALLRNFRTIFRPAISKQDGFIAVRLLKLRKAVAGEAPTKANFRLVITFKSEEQRVKWATSKLHDEEAWPSIQKNLRTPNVTAVLYDTIG